MAISAEKKVGLFFTLGLIIMGILLELGGEWNPFEKRLHYKTYLSSTVGLKVGDSVRLAGVDVGKIKEIALEGNRVKVAFYVRKGTEIKTDTVASMRLTNLLGGQFLSLSFGSPATPILPDGSVVKSKEIVNIDMIAENVSELAKDARTLVNDLNEVVSDNRDNLRDALSNLNNITAKIDRGQGSLAMLLNDKSLYNDASEATRNLKDITGTINRGEGTIGKLVKDEALYKDAKSAIANLNDGMKEVKDITGKINRGEGTIGKLVNDETIYKDASETTRNLKEITRKINEGQGTIGKLVNEDKLYRDATATLKKTEKAMEGAGDAGPITVLGGIIGTLF